MEKGYIRLPDGQLHYCEEGSGEPLILLHQAPLNSSEWHGVMPFLSRKYRVIALDLPGHGNSYNLPREYEVEDFTKTIIQFMDAMGIKKTNLGGNHSGSAISMSVAVAHPERVNRLIISGETLATLDQIHGFLEGLKSKPMSRDLPMDEEGKFLAEAWGRYKVLAPEAALNIRYRPFIIGLAARQQQYDIHMPVLRWMEREDRMPKLKCPTLIFSGTKDLFFNRTVMEGAAMTYPFVRVAYIEGGGAMVCFEQPQAVADALLKFLTSN